MPKLTSKQRAFVRYVVEGDTYSGAYRKAYNAVNMSNDSIKVEASRLMSSPNIALTVMEMQEEVRERTIVTVESQTERLRGLALKAEGYDTSAGVSAAVSAEKEVNKLNGLITDKVEATVMTHESILDLLNDNNNG